MGLWVGEKNEYAKKFYQKFGFRWVSRKGIWDRMILDLDEVNLDVF